MIDWKSKKGYWSEIIANRCRVTVESVSTRLYKSFVVVAPHCCTTSSSGYHSLSWNLQAVSNFSESCWVDGLERSLLLWTGLVSVTLWMKIAIHFCLLVNLYICWLVSDGHRSFKRGIKICPRRFWWKWWVRSFKNSPVSFAQIAKMTDCLNHFHATIASHVAESITAWLPRKAREICWTEGAQLAH